MRQIIDELIRNYAEEGNTATAELQFPSGFVGFQGHFPDQPVLPGVCQIMLSMVMADRMCGRRKRVEKVINTKFISVVRPGRPLHIRCTLIDGRLTADILSEDERVAQINLKVEDA